MKRDTTLATEVQWTSDFIAIKTVLGPHLAVNEKSQRQYTQQATNAPQKAATVLRGLRHTPILILAQFLLHPLYFEQLLNTKYMF